MISEIVIEYIKVNYLWKKAKNPNWYRLQFKIQQPLIEKIQFSLFSSNSLNYNYQYYPPSIQDNIVLNIFANSTQFHQKTLLNKLNVTHQVNFDRIHNEQYKNRIIDKVFLYKK